MTAALLERQAASPSGPPCPPWCTNRAHPWAAEKDMCDAGGGDRWHTGRIGGVVLPSRVNEYYDEEIGVELFRCDNADGTLHQLSVLLTYSSEMTEVGYVTLDITDARRLVDLTRSTPPGNQTRFADPADNNIVVEHRRGGSSSRIDMNVEGHRPRLSLHEGQLRGLGDIIACACLLAEVAR